MQTDAEKVFDNIQNPFMIKTLSKVGREGNFLNMIQAKYEKPTAKFILNGKKLKTCAPKIRNRKRTPAFIISI